MKDLPERLAELIESSVKKAVEGKRVAISFSGGIDSTTLAYLSKKYAKSVSLYTVGFSESSDVHYSIEISDLLDLDLNVYYLEEEEIKRLYTRVEELFSLGFLKSEILAPIQKIFEIAKEKYVLFGSGAEELFVGYERYYRWREEGIPEEEISSRLKEEFNFLINKGDIYYINRLAELNNKVAVFPYCDNSIAELSLNSPIELRFKDKERKKYLIRKAAETLGVPFYSIERAKKALQYGSGVHKVLLKMKKNGKIK